MRSTLRFVFLGLLLACGSPPDPVSPPRDDASDVAQLREATAQWRTTYDLRNRDPILALCEEYVERAQVSVELDLVLADALSNVLLRPDLGIPRYERHLSTLTPEQWSGYADALLRHQKLEKLAKAHEAREGSLLDVDHLAAQQIANQSLLDPKLGWQDLRDGMRAVRLVEESNAQIRRELDRPVESAELTLEILGHLLEGWTIEAVTARTTLPDDTDPWSTSGAWAAKYDTRRVSGYVATSDPSELARIGRNLDADPPLRVTNVGLRLEPPTGGQLLLVFDGTRRNDVLWMHSSNNPRRAVQLLDAAAAWKDAGRSPDALPAIRERFRDGFLTEAD